MSKAIQSPEQMMSLALAEAEKARALGEVPVGAVICLDGRIIGAGHNRKEGDRDPLGHAEIHAIRQAAQTLGAWRLSGATLAVTLEPCPMCAGAMVQARISKLIYGCSDPKAGAAGTLFNLVADPRLNHRLEVEPGVLAQECAERLSSFFRTLRSGLPREDA